MNIGQLKKNIGTVITLFPRPKLGNESIAAARNKWLIVAEVEGAKSLELSNTVTEHGFSLPYDSIREFRMPNLLILRAQIVLSGKGVELVPFTDSPDDKPYDEALRQSDITVFTRLDAIGNEPLIDKLLNFRICTGTVKFEEKQLIEDLIIQLQRIENRYLDVGLRARAEELAKDLDAVYGIVGRTFFGDGNDRLKFYPDLIDPKTYNKEWKELNEKLSRAWHAYVNYRSAVKERLMV